MPRKTKSDRITKKLLAKPKKRKLAKRVRTITRSQFNKNPKYWLQRNDWKFA